MNENTPIENIQRLIQECQKKIQLNYSILHSDDLEDNIAKSLIEEIGALRERVTNYQARMKVLYKELFSGSRKVQKQVL